MNIKKVISIITAAAVVFSVLSINVLAAVNPWDSYAKFIPDKTPFVKRDLRAVWISTVLNLDWPSLQTRNIKNDEERIQKSKHELISILDEAVELNINAVFFQVSPEGDALYKSSIVPWSRYLTGTFGKDPGFDPLAFAVQEAHKRSLEIHAWFNPYRVSMNTDAVTKASLNIAKSVYKEHPQWIKTSAGRFVVDPGIPEARSWVINRVMEVVKNYDIDGIHFDDYFYYENYYGELKDQDTFKKYNNGQFSNLGDWRRNNTYLLIRTLSKKIRTTKPWVKFGISPAGVWGNKRDGHPDGSNTRAGFTNYDRSFADTKKWVREELIDYIAPQIYFSFANPYAPYGEVASWWANICRGKKVHLYIGQALYKINNDSDQYFKGVNAVSEFARQIKFNISNPDIMGSIMFRMNNFNDSDKQKVVNEIKNSLWAAKSLVPVMAWKGGNAPAVPTQGKLESVSDGIKLSWINNDSKAVYFAIYRFNKGEKTDFTSDTSASKLIGTVRKNKNQRQEFIDTEVSSADSVVYVVTALDRLHNESGGLNIIKTISEYFSDIGSDYSWAVDEIDDLYERGILKGTSDGIFSPEYSTKRGDFILMIIRTFNFTAIIKDNFADVTEGSYYYDAVGIAKTLNIVKGNGKTFDPNGSITREDMMVILMRALEMSGFKLEKAGEECLANYKDANFISEYAREAAASLTKAGIIQGADGSLNPKGRATRAEIAVILYRVLENQ